MAGVHAASSRTNRRVSPAARLHPRRATPRPAGSLSRSDTRREGSLPASFTFRPVHRGNPFSPWSCPPLTRRLLGRQVRPPLPGHRRRRRSSTKAGRTTSPASWSCPTSPTSAASPPANSPTGSGSPTSTPTTGSSNPTSSAWPPSPTAASPPPNPTSPAPPTSTACQITAATAALRPEENPSATDSCPFTALYWTFLERNESVLAGNLRMQMPYTTLRRKPLGELVQLRARAEQAVAHLQSFSRPDY